MLVRTPDNSNSGTVCESPVEWLDIGPTLVELTGSELQHRQFGKSLCPVLTNPDATHRDFAISEIQGEIMLLNQEWKAALNSDGKVYLLFDVQNDPNETNNLAGKPEVADVETTLRLQILERLMQTQLKEPFRE